MSPVLEFGPFQFDRDTGELRKGSHPLKVHGQATRILSILLERPGELISREEFYRQLWPHGTFLDVDHGLSSAVNRLRNNLSDSADRPRYIETLPGRGYRFIAAVKTVARDGAGSVLATQLCSELEQGQVPGVLDPTVTDDPQRKPRSTSFWPYWWGGAILIAGALILASTLARRGRSRPRPETPTLAVLPFANLASQKDDYFSEGLTEEIQDALSRVTSLRVVATTSAAALKKEGADVNELGRRLNVSSVLEGSVRREGQNIRVSARLVGTSDGYQIWSQTYTVVTGSIFRMQEEIARNVAEVLQGRLSRANLAHLRQIGTADEEAHELYLSGAWLLDRARSSQQQLQAVGYLEKAANKDPKYAAPLSVLAQYYTGHSMSDPLCLSKARSLALKAVSLDEGSAAAHSALAAVLVFEWEWMRAEQEFLRAISLQPSYWPARSDFALFLTMQGRFGEARQVIDQAEVLSPVDIDNLCLKALVDYYERRYSTALPLFHRRHQIDRDNHTASLFLAQTLFRTGQIGDSIALFQEELGTPREDAEYRYEIRSLAFVYGAIHDVKNALKMLEQLRNLSRTHPVPAFDYAIVYAGIGDREMAFRYLAQSYQEHSLWMTFTKIEPMFEGLHDDPRFADLVSRVGLK